MISLTLLLIVVMILSLCSTIYFSMVSRRKGPSSLIYRSYMNLSMGFLFVSLAVHLYTFSLSLLGNILATLILLVGLINLYYAIKMNRYLRQSQAENDQEDM
jgi:hypothetical protein